MSGFKQFYDIRMYTNSCIYKEESVGDSLFVCLIFIHFYTFAHISIKFGM
jgi:hypothetical protein